MILQGMFAISLSCFLWLAGNVLQSCGAGLAFYGHVLIATRFQVSVAVQM
jgi:hypothetical protein